MPLVWRVLSPEELLLFRDFFSWYARRCFRLLAATEGAEAAEGPAVLAVEPAAGLYPSFGKPHFDCIGRERWGGADELAH